MVSRFLRLMFDDSDAAGLKHRHTVVLTPQAIFSYYAGVFQDRQREEYSVVRVA